MAMKKHMATRTYPLDPTDPDNKTWKVYKQGQWVRLPYIRKFNPSYHAKLHPGQILPVWYYKFQDKAELYVVEISEGMLFFHSAPEKDVIGPTPVIEAQILNHTTANFLVEQAVLQHGRMRALCHRIEGRDANYAHKMADECHILFVRMVYERAMKMGLDPDTLHLRDFDPHKRWLREMYPKISRTAFTNFILKFVPEVDDVSITTVTTPTTWRTSELGADGNILEKDMEQIGAFAGLNIK